MGCNTIQVSFTCQTDRTTDTRIKGPNRLSSIWPNLPSCVSAGFIDHKPFTYAQSWAFSNGDVGQEERWGLKEPERTLLKTLHHVTVKKTLCFVFKLCRTMKSPYCSCRNTGTGRKMFSVLTAMEYNYESIIERLTFFFTVRGVYSLSCSFLTAFKREKVLYMTISSSLIIQKEWVRNQTSKKMQCKSWNIF